MLLDYLEFVPSTPCAQTVVTLRCLRGLDTPSAVGLPAEIGDFTRFKRAGQLMSGVSLLPAENSAGQTHRQGQITKTGSRHARRLALPQEFAAGITLQRRQHG